MKFTEALDGILKANGTINPEIEISKAETLEDVSIEQISTEN